MAKPEEPTSAGPRSPRDISNRGPRISRRQRKLIQGRVRGLTVKRAAIEAGYPGAPESARVRGSQDLAKPSVRAAYQAALERAGCTVDATARVIAEAHRATQVKVFYDKNEGIVESKPYVDWDKRLRAAELAGKLNGAFADEGPKAQLNIGAIIAIIRQAADERGVGL